MGRDEVLFVPRKKEGGESHGIEKNNVPLQGIDIFE